MIPRALVGDPAGLVVIDWSMLVRKAWHVNGIENVASVTLGRLWRILSDPMPQSIAIAVDPERVDEHGRAIRRRTWRDKATEHLPPREQYKAGRIPKPPELVAIERRLFQVVRALRIPFLLPANPADEQGYDADDAIGTAVKICSVTNRSVAIVTEDKDLLQCVTTENPMLPNVVRWWPFLSPDQRDKGEPEEYGDAETFARWSVSPAQMTDFLAIMGDNGDNIPGVKGIGDKGAAKILFDHGDLDTALSREPTNRSERLLHQQKDQALASRSLVRLWTDAPISWRPDRQMTGGFDVPALRDALKSFGFARMAEDIPVFPKAQVA